MEFHLFKSREKREQEFQARILEIASIAVVEALDRRAEGESMPFQVEIPPVPHRMEAKDYLDGVQSGVGMTLDLCEQVDIACDEYYSSLANARVATGRTNTSLFTRHYRNMNPRLIFHELSPAEQV
ncbi:MAG TPA: hypothetical protein VFH99_03895 [Candidatus Saccharimonadales bacterium]|nr:hypothetical protein [Candidatus Saccharimonadales bacterium]